MKIGFITFSNKPLEFNPDVILNDKGHECVLHLNISENDKPLQVLDFAKDFCEAIIIDGQTDNLYNILSEKYHIERNCTTFEIDKILYAIAAKCDEKFILDIVIPMLNSKHRTFYNSVVFKTFGKTESDLKQILKENIKNRNKIVFNFYPSLLQCDIHVRFSSSMAKTTVDTMINDLKNKLLDCTYSFNHKTLEEIVAQNLKIQNRKLKIAESFTGGALTQAFTKMPGSSEYLIESIIAYNNISKHKRLNVESKILEQSGAVSIETAYEMAAGLLLSGDCDTVLATTGYAGPDADDSQNVGLCFIVAGDKDAIHIFKYNFEGDRETVIQSGVKTALYKLFELLTKIK